MKSIGKRDAELWKVLAGSLGIASFGLLLLSRPLINRLNDYFLKTIMTDPYAENLWGFISAATRTRAQNIIENNLREKDYTFDYSKQPSQAMKKYRKAFLLFAGKTPEIGSKEF